MLAHSSHYWPFAFFYYPFTVLVVPIYIDLVAVFIAALSKTKAKDSQVQSLSEDAVHDVSR